MKNKISIVIPAFNEEESIPLLTKQLYSFFITIPQYSFEVIFVENGSVDNTLKVLLAQRKNYKNIKIVQLSKNVGWDEGISVGLNYATGDAAVVMVADLQDDPELIRTFIKKWKEGYEIVYTVIKKREGGKASFGVGIYLFNKLMNVFTNNLLPENASEYSLLDKKVYLSLLSFSERYKFFRGFMHWIGYKKIAVVRKRKDRVAGKSKATFFTASKFALNGLVGFSYLPLKFSYVLFLILLTTATISFFITKIEIGVFFFLFSILFLMMGIQGEYLERVVEEVRNRPRFLIKETFGIDKKYYGNKK